MLDTLSDLRIISPRQTGLQHHDRSSSVGSGDGDNHNAKAKSWVHLSFPMNFVTVPLIGDLFLLTILAIGREEVKGGTIGSDNISPVDVMIFFITLAYIAISIDSSGLIRYLAFKVLQKGGKVGHKLFFYLYAFFFALGSFIGNDPIILSGTAFLAYMTRVSSNIVHPRAWIHTQFAVANIASAILVSSNPTNLVLAGAFGIKFIEYTANIIVPVIVTVVLLFPLLLYVVFADEALIPFSITMHELSEEAKAKKPVNPNIPNARGSAAEEGERLADNEHGNLLSLEEIMNPFLDKGGAAFGAVIMAATLITLLAINAASQSSHQHPVAYVTVPAAFVMLFWDLGFGWCHRHETREIARKGREEVQRARAERTAREKTETTEAAFNHGAEAVPMRQSKSHGENIHSSGLFVANAASPVTTDTDIVGDKAVPAARTTGGTGTALEQLGFTTAPTDDCSQALRSDHATSANNERQNTAQEVTAIPFGKAMATRRGLDAPVDSELDKRRRSRATLVSLVSDGCRWCQETFPTVTAVLAHLPFGLVPFAFAMFVLVQALVTKGWVQVFAHAWDHFVQKTGTVGSIGGMAFLSVILCNVSYKSFVGIKVDRAYLLKHTSFRERISALPSFCPVSSRHGYESTKPTEPISPTGRSGPQYMPWPLVSITVPSAQLSAPHWLGYCGGISLLGSISMCGGSSLRA